MDTIRRGLAGATALAVVLAGTTAANAESAPIDEMETEPVVPAVQRLLDDGADHDLRFIDGPGRQPHDLVVTSEGSVMISVAREPRQQLDRFDAWPYDVWVLGEPGSQMLLVPTAKTGVAEGPDGRLWVAGEGHYLASLGGESPQVHVEQGSVIPYVDHVVSDDGTIWALYGDGLVRFDGERWLAVDGPAGPISEDEGDLELSADGTLWALTGRGRLAAYDGAEWRPVGPPRRAEGEVWAAAVRAIDVDAGGHLWAVWTTLGDGGCSTSLARFDGSAWETVRDIRIPGRDRDRSRVRRGAACPAPDRIRVDGLGGGWISVGAGLVPIAEAVPHVVLFAETDIRDFEIDADGNAYVVAIDHDPQTTDVYLVEALRRPG